MRMQALTSTTASNNHGPAPMDIGAMYKGYKGKGKVKVKEKAKERAKEKAARVTTTTVSTTATAKEAKEQ